MILVQHLTQLDSQTNLFVLDSFSSVLTTECVYGTVSGTWIKDSSWIFQIKFRRTRIFGKTKKKKLK